jgi:uncharacterized membrane protein
MKRPFPTRLGVAAAIAALTVVSAFVTVPVVVRAVLGLVTVFVLPGFAVERALNADRDAASDEQPFVWLGVSLAVGVVAAVALAASPVGLSRRSFAVVVGGFATLLSLYAGLRAVTRDSPHEVVSDG